MKKIGVLVSGGGTNLQAIIDSCIKNEINAAVCIVISNRPNVFALERAAKHRIPSCVIEKKDYQTQNLFTTAIADKLEEYGVDYVVFAGFTQILTEEIVQRYPKKMLNIHPSLIPKHCGKGFWGIKVHESVIASGDKVSGVTVHFADEGCDTGEILLQKTMPVDDNDSAESLQKKVLQLEHIALVEALRILCNA